MTMECRWPEVARIISHVCGVHVEQIDVRFDERFRARPRTRAHKQTGTHTHTRAREQGQRFD